MRIVCSAFVAFVLETAGRCAASSTANDSAATDVGELQQRRQQRQNDKNKRKLQYNPYQPAPYEPNVANYQQQTYYQPPAYPTCPDPWRVGVYNEGDQVSSNGYIYQCKAPHASGWCGMVGYEPNVDVATPGAWKLAWTEVGHCTYPYGAPYPYPSQEYPANDYYQPEPRGYPAPLTPYHPTPAVYPTPNYGVEYHTPLYLADGADCTNDKEGCMSGLFCCPSEVNGSDRYFCRAHDCVAGAYLPPTYSVPAYPTPAVYPTPPTMAYPPTYPVPAYPTPVAYPVYTTMSPTKKPTLPPYPAVYPSYPTPQQGYPEAYPQMGAYGPLPYCPSSVWYFGAVYSEGDRVCKDGIIYECKSWPYSTHCGQAGYEPDTNPATPGAWTFAWTKIGPCTGTCSYVPPPTPYIAPTPYSPSTPYYPTYTPPSYPTMDPLYSAPTMDPLYSAPTTDPLYSAPTMDPLYSAPTMDPLYSAPTMDPLPYSPYNPTPAVYPTPDPPTVTYATPSYFADGADCTNYKAGCTPGYCCPSEVNGSDRWFCRPHQCLAAAYPPPTYSTPVYPTPAVYPTPPTMAYPVAPIYPTPAYPTPVYPTPAYNDPYAACGSAWSMGTVYSEGDRVVKDGIIYQCKAWPYSGHCGQAGYEPNTNPATPGAWTFAWTKIGPCNYIEPRSYDMPHSPPTPGSSPTPQWSAIPAGNEFIDPSQIPNAVRGPCPAINTLANHGFIPRNGIVDVDELAVALEVWNRIDRNFIRSGAIQDAINLGLTFTCSSPSGICLSIDQLGQNEFNSFGMPALEHDASFFRDESVGPDDIGLTPSSLLVNSFFTDQSGFATLDIQTVMNYQRERIEESCAFRVSQGSPRVWTPGHRINAAKRAALLFVMAQAGQGKPEREKAFLRSIVEDERYPDDYHPDPSISFNFGAGCSSNALRETFRYNVEWSLCNNPSCGGAVGDLDCSAIGPVPPIVPLDPNGC